MKRRRLLALTGSSLAALAGCLGDSDDAGDGTAGPVGNGGDETGNGDGENGDEEEYDETELEEIAREFVDSLAGGEYEEAYSQLAEAAQGLSSPGDMEGLWRGYVAVGGEFQEIVDASIETTQRGTNIDFTLAFERSDHDLRVITAAHDGQIYGAVPYDEYSQPAYVDEDAFESEPTILETETCEMDGTLTLPEEDDVPGVVLVHGNEAFTSSDKDLTTGLPTVARDGSRPFQDIAEGLASKGIAVLRYDKRTTACPDSLDIDERTLDTETVDDALAAIEHLRSVDGVDPDRISVAGLGFGGMATPRIAERDDNVAGGIGLAAPARPFYEVVFGTFEGLSGLGEYEWDQIQASYEAWQDGIDDLRNGEYEPGDGVLGYAGALWASLAAYDHIETAREIDTPLLFCQGSRDFHVSPTEDYELWQSELDERAGVSFEEYDGLNHLFQFGTGPSVPTEYRLSNPVSFELIDDLATWVLDLE